MLQVAEILSLRSVEVSLGGRRILTDVSFDLRAGEFCGLVGANGSGKTTLLRTILGSLKPSAGTIVVDGSGKTHGAGYVPQKVLLDQNLPVRARDVVGLGLDGHRFGLPLRSGERRRAVDEMLRAVDAAHFADARIGDLSGGQQQRILIAHALIRRPRLLLLDEPLANLDVRSVSVIVSLLRRLANAHRVAVLMSTHDVNPLLSVMDRVVYLAHGRAASGTAASVIRTEVLSRLYGHHVDVIRVHGRLLVVTDEPGALAAGGDGADAGVHAEPVP